MFIFPLTHVEAHALYDVLVAEGGARETDRANFVLCYTKRDGEPLPTEWRFQGNFGYGGKFYYPNFRVNYYAEDETPQRQQQREQANAKLANLQAEIEARQHRLNRLLGESGRIHYLKILPQYFSHVLDGTKTFEIRRNDRDFAVGDCVLLEEYDPLYQPDDQAPLAKQMNHGYTGRHMLCRITYMTDFEQKPDYVVFSIKAVANEA